MSGISWNRKNSLLLAAVILLFVSPVVLAQQDIENAFGISIRIEMESGSVFQGTLISVEDGKLELLNPDGQYVYLDLNSVKEFSLINNSRDRREYYEDSVSNRLLFLPTAFPMENGDFHVADQEILVITSSYGLRDHVSLWGGISPIAGMISARYSFNASSRLAFLGGRAHAYRLGGRNV